MADKCPLITHHHQPIGQETHDIPQLIMETRKILEAKLNAEEKDRLAAELVMGWVIHWEIRGWTGKKIIYWFTQERKRVYNWHPTTDIKQAMMVVEKMRERGYNFCLILRQDGATACCFTKDHNFSGNAVLNKITEEAIVTAALNALEAK